MTKPIQLLITFVIVIGTATAAPSHSSHWVKRFDVIPGTCIVDESEHRCIRQFTFYWQLFEAQLVCIYQKSHQEPLYCSESRIEGSERIKLNIDRDNEFILVSQLNNSHRVHRQVLVQQLGIDVRKAKRHLWSVF
ncbi:DUF3019 domain-containing protein [Thalassotalea sp. ND16A]|uniref:DUF3019 domain-containing protein n=1 Tax=Thalassotalea sp. ND16A TaxID=1535422 RepID=UPI00051A14F3|nr:DUF3019 domain-containing protein [Thalassotalea sp. ND16A]KGJ90519.1 hypothetical protein ND16A_1915 [Thalassotalea sp. ND16A]